MFTYEPIASSASPDTAVEDSIAVVDPTTSGSLNALSVLESALSQLSTAQPTANTPEPIVIDISSSKVVFVPLPTTTTGTQSPELSTHAEQDPDQTALSAGVLFSASGSDAILSIGTDGVAIIDASRTTHVSLPEATISSLLSGTVQTHDVSAPTSSQESNPTSSTIPEADNDPTGNSASLTESTFVYSPLDASPNSKPTTTNISGISSSPPRPPSSGDEASVSASGSATTASELPVVVPQPGFGSGSDYGSGSGSGGVQSGSGSGSGSATSTSATGSDSETTSELPVVVQQPGNLESSTDSSSSAASTATGTGTGTGNGEEEEVDSSNGAGKSAGLRLSVVAVVAMFVIAALLA